jgi:hypothetical protein
MTGGCLALRSESFYNGCMQSANDGIGGPKATLGSAIACGILLGVFEGIGVLLSRTMGEVNRPIAPSRTSSSRLCLHRFPDQKDSGASSRIATNIGCLIFIHCSFFMVSFVYATSPLVHIFFCNAVRYALNKSERPPHH